MNDQQIAEYIAQGIAKGLGERVARNHSFLTHEHAVKSGFQQLGTALAYDGSDDLKQGWLDPTIQSFVGALLNLDSQHFAFAPAARGVEGKSGFVSVYVESRPDQSIDIDIVVLGS